MAIADPSPTAWRVAPEPPLQDPVAIAALREIHGFLDREQFALARDYADLCAKPLNERIEAGDTVGPVLSLTSVKALSSLLGDVASLPGVRELLSPLDVVDHLAALPIIADILALPVISDVLGIPGLGTLAALIRQGTVIPLLTFDYRGERLTTGERFVLGPAAVGEVAVSRGIPVEVVDIVPRHAGRSLVLVKFERRDLPGGQLPALLGDLYLDPQKIDLTASYRAAAHAALGGRGVSSLVRTLVLDGPTWVDADEEAALLATADPSLHPKQTDAFASLARSPLALVQGPPGTGKTHVIAAMVEHLTARGQRVLLCAMAHMGVNNALNGCSKRLGRSVSLVKYGKPHQTAELPAGIENIEHRRELEAFVESHPGGVVIGTSIARAAWLHKANIRFDVVIIDEASQLTLPRILCAANLAPRAVLVGDHKQLPPIVNGDHTGAPAWTRMSAFEYLAEIKDVPRALLTESRRLNDRLVEFPSGEFYNGELRASPESSGRRLTVDLFPGDPLANLLDPAHPLVWALVAHRSGAYSPHEADLVVQLVQHAVCGNVRPKDIAVVSPYRVQNRLIRQDLRALLGPQDAAVVLVDTVEKLQGQERELVILSLAVGDESDSAHNAAFVYSPHRLNVTITRAKSKCIVVGSESLLWPSDLSDPLVRDGAALFQRLFGCCHEVRMTRDDPTEGNVGRGAAPVLPPSAATPSPVPATEPRPSRIGRLLGRRV